jgi:hypothetical protein
MIGKYSLSNMINAYKNNKDIIEAYINNKPIENYGGDMFILGLTLPIFLITFLVVIITWVAATYYLIINFELIPVWAQAIGILSLLGFGGPLITVIVVLIGKKYKNM